MLEIDLGHPADYHVHLRQGEMTAAVTPAVRKGGMSIAYVMPNLTPPVTDIERVQKYKAELQRISPKTTFLMTFYLSKVLTPEVVYKAAKLGAIQGIKCYPAGVTTNSGAGIDPSDFSRFYPIFKVMQDTGLVLNIHGERPSIQSEGINVINAEPKFLPALFAIHRDFPRLRIVLEHCTTRAAIHAISEINKDLKKGEIPTVVGSITAHHLFLTIDDWTGNPVNYCKPVAKFAEDRDALVKAATSGKSYFIFGSDSAPHEISKKCTFNKIAAGVYTQPYVLSYLAELFERNGKLDMLKNFVSKFGSRFYGMDDESKLACKDRCYLVKKPVQIPEKLCYNGIELTIFRPCKELSWSVEWR